MLDNINHTQISNDFLDNWMSKLSGSAVKIFLAIARKTIGWHKETDRISYSQLIIQTGLTKDSIAKGIKELESNNLILVIRSEKQTSSYEINYNLVEKTGQSTPENRPELPKSTPKNRHTKESIKEKERKENVSVLISLFGNLYEKKYSIKPVINFGKDNKILKSLNFQPPEIVAAKMEMYFKNAYWFNKQGHTIGGFVQHFNEIIQKEQPKRSDNWGN